MFQQVAWQAPPRLAYVRCSLAVFSYAGLSGNSNSFWNDLVASCVEPRVNPVAASIACGELWRSVMIIHQGIGKRHAMNKYVIAAVLIAAAIEPASAPDAGVGGGVGGVGVDSGLGVDNEGAALGAGTSVDGVGGANVGGSVGTSNGTPGVGVGADGELGGTSGGLSTGVGSGGAGPGSPTGGSAAAPGGPAGGSTAAPGGTPGGSVTGSGPTASGTATTPGAATTPGIRQAKGVGQAITLPHILLPSKARSDKSGQGVAPLKAIPGTPSAVVRVCHQAIESAARPLGAVNVHAASAGPLSRQRRGALTAPIHVRIDYESQGGIYFRQARIRCHLDVAGRVIGVT